MGKAVTQTVAYWLSEHPTIVGFRWSTTQSWGATWMFLFTSVSSYILLSLFLHTFLLLALRRRRSPFVPLGPIPALHSLSMALVSATIFAGILLSAAAEIRDTRWFWRRTRTTPFQWFLCFPLGTRPSGRVFFWSYIFYLSRFLHMVRTFLTVLRFRRLAFVQLFNNSILTIMSFLWLEFSQSLQVLAILSTTLIYSVVYGYRFWTAIGLPSACFPFVLNCQVILLGCNFVCHVGVLLFHFIKGGCNGIGAWVINSVLNGLILMLFLNFYVRTMMGSGKNKKMDIDIDTDTDNEINETATDSEDENKNDKNKKKKKKSMIKLSPRVRVGAAEKVHSCSGLVQSRSHLKLKKTHKKPTKE